MRWLFVGVIALNLLYLGWRLAGVDEVAPPPAVAAEPATFPAPLALVGERGGPAVAPAPAPAPVSLSGCPAVGPFAVGEDAGRVAESLSRAGFAARARTVDLKGVPVYWVYLPPFADRPAAQRKLRELHVKGIDSFVVTEGGDANAISLGTFTSRDSALGVQSRLRAAGYGVDIREQLRDLRQDWVVLEAVDAQGYLEHVPAEFRDKVRQERMTCGGR